MSIASVTLPAGERRGHDAELAALKRATPQQWNRYAYVRTNPLRFIDPDGRCSKPSKQTEEEAGICIEAFIAAQRIMKVGLGDDRTFSGTDEKLTARSRVKRTIDSKGRITSQSVESGVSNIFTKGFGLQGTTVANVATRQYSDGSIGLHVSIWGRNGEGWVPFALSGVIQGHFKGAHVASSPSRR